MGGQTLAETSTGPNWILYVIVVPLAMMSVMLLSGKGAWLIAGYNTASKEEKEKYNKKRLSKIVGGGMAIISVVLLFMGIFENVLPASFGYVFLIIIIIDVIAMLVLCNTVCKVKK